MRKEFLNKTGGAKYKTREEIKRLFDDRKSIPIDDVFSLMDLRIINGMSKRGEIVFNTELRRYESVVN